MISKKLRMNTKPGKPFVSLGQGQKNKGKTEKEQQRGSSNRKNNPRPTLHSKHQKKNDRRLFLYRNEKKKGWGTPRRRDRRERNVLKGKTSVEAGEGK